MSNDIYGHQETERMLRSVYGLSEIDIREIMQHL